MIILKEKLRRRVTDFSVRERRIRQNLRFAYEHRKFKGKQKIFYAITPPPDLKNIGDHAQVIAIRAWLKKHFPTLPVIEVDKNQGSYFLPALKWLIQNNDLIFLHSGGNLGDRGIWSESKRREIISTFYMNQIVSLPQTIFFSDSHVGKEEQEATSRIYMAHPNLTIIGRDPRSGELAEKLFPKAKTFCMPDFVLSLQSRQAHIRDKPEKALLCLRHDDESNLTEEQRRKIADYLPYESTYYDTTLEKPILLEERESVLETTLKLFSDSDIVVTDRYHGLIFSILSQKPCIVLRTVDHKLTSAFHWFKDVPFVRFAQTLDEIPSLVEACLQAKQRQVPDWNSNYFDKLPKMLGLAFDSDFSE